MSEPTGPGHVRSFPAALEAVCLVAAIPASLYTAFFLFGQWFYSATRTQFPREDDYSILFIALAQLAAPYLFPLVVIGSAAGLGFHLKGPLRQRWMTFCTLACLVAVGAVIYGWSTSGPIPPIPQGGELLSLSLRTTGFWLAILASVALIVILYTESRVE